ncbi:hypothetical protein BD410DRAFT_71607 [Rickenella mellea]|uniref:Uncharacterized protein n=1 Tax=Rickenella mellea TaxID=50990 RepID=A0A4Y7QC95_9AGAM|nr:hypothetical protein BD410DRAFT_71607 [Rickenella mellea]
MSTPRLATPGNLKERIAALQQRSTSPHHGQQQQTSPGTAQTSSSSGNDITPPRGSLRDKIAKFEKKGGIPVPRGSFGLGAPTPAPADAALRRRGELYGNRIPSVGLGNPKNTPLRRDSGHTARASSMSNGLLLRGYADFDSEAGSPLASPALSALSVDDNFSSPSPSHGSFKLSPTEPDSDVAAGRRFASEPIVIDESPLSTIPDNNAEDVDQPPDELPKSPVVDISGDADAKVEANESIVSEDPVVPAAVVKDVECTKEQDTPMDPQQPAATDEPTPSSLVSSSIPDISVSEPAHDQLEVSDSTNFPITDPIHGEADNAVVVPPTEDVTLESLPINSNSLEILSTDSTHGETDGAVVPSSDSVALDSLSVEIDRVSTAHASDSIEEDANEDALPPSPPGVQNLSLSPVDIQVVPKLIVNEEIPKNDDPDESSPGAMQSPFSLLSRPFPDQDLPSPPLTPYSEIHHDVSTAPQALPSPLSFVHGPEVDLPSPMTEEFVHDEVLDTAGQDSTAGAKVAVPGSPPAPSRLPVFSAPPKKLESVTSTSGSRNVSQGRTDTSDDTAVDKSTQPRGSSGNGPSTSSRHDSTRRRAYPIPPPVYVQEYNEPTVSLPIHPPSFSVVVHGRTTDATASTTFKASSDQVSKEREQSPRAQPHQQVLTLRSRIPVRMEPMTPGSPELFALAAQAAMLEEQLTGGSGEKKDTPLKVSKIPKLSPSASPISRTPPSPAEDVFGLAAKNVVAVGPQTVEERKASTAQAQLSRSKSVREVEIPPTPPPKAGLSWRSTIHVGSMIPRRERTSSVQYHQQDLQQKQKHQRGSSSSEMSSVDSSFVATPPSPSFDLAELGSIDGHSLRSSRSVGGLSPKSARKRAITRSATLVNKLLSRAGRSNITLSPPEDTSVDNNRPPSPIPAFTPLALSPTIRDLDRSPARSRPTSMISTGTSPSIFSPSFDREIFDEFPSVPGSMPATHDIPQPWTPTSPHLETTQVAPDLPAKSPHLAPKRLLDDTVSTSTRSSFSSIRSKTFPLRFNSSNKRLPVLPTVDLGEDDVEAPWINSHRVLG